MESESSLPYAQRYARFTLQQYLCMTVASLTKLRFTCANAVRRNISGLKLKIIPAEIPEV